MRSSSGILVLAVLAACGRGDSTHRSGDAGPSAPNVVTVTASDFSFDAPAEISAGLTTIRLVNRGPSLHHIQLIKLEEGKTVEDLLGAFKSPGPPPKWMSSAGGPNPPEVGDTTNTTLSLKPGSYAMLCFVPTPDGMPHMMKGLARPLKVTGTAPANVAEPMADVVITLHDYDFKFSKPLTAGRHTIRIDNAGPQEHEIAIVRLNPGKTPVEFAEWGEKQVGPAPGKMLGGVSGIVPGMHASIDVTFIPGQYALLCFVPDMKDGKPHFAHGMAKLIEVS
jgi:hypothetical protein